MNYYKQHAERLMGDYNNVDPEHVHALWRDFLPEQLGLACDIGAGSGRDANWLAGMGWDVVAVEPCQELRELAQEQSRPEVSWIDDTLPALSRLRELDQRFNLILINAVWMHLPEKQRQRAMRIVSELLAPNGLLVITIKQDADQAELARREQYLVPPEELLQQAKQRALSFVKRGNRKDELGRDQVSWETLCFQLPDDGTGSLPLLRHIIVNDNKSSSYKLGLLRVLLRVAEGAPGMVLNRTDDYVDIPLGILGLYWLKLYIPLLIKNEIRQQKRAYAGLLFATDDFYALEDISSFDLRIGARFTGDQARHVTGAIRAACYNIKENPGHFTTFPGTDRQVFHCDYMSVRSSTKPVQLDKEFLSRFGTVRVPSRIWQTLGQYTCWLEPAIVNEWVNLMASWEVRYNTDVYYQALEWDEGRHDTSEVRRIAEQLHGGDHSLRCVWTNTNLARKQYAVDHCFPWSRWFNNDLWNLMPTSLNANSRKSDKLPSAELVKNAKPRILNWWDEAYVAGDMNERFFVEAEAALPFLEAGDRDLQRVFDALLLQRQRLRANQGLAEWGP
ncbi:MAG: methyltransferase domain-containing protein [Halieaceae bacterium]